MNNIIQSQYEDRTKFLIISEKKELKGSHTHINQILLDTENNVNISRKLIFYNFTGTPKQLENIRKRSILPKFGDAVNDIKDGINKKTTQQEPVWMEFNPELLKSTATQKSIAKLLINKNSDEKIKLIDINNNPEKTKETLKQELEKINSKYNCDVGNTRINSILDYSNNPNENKITFNITKKKSILSLPFKIGGGGKYIPPSLRRKNTHSSDKSNNSMGTKKYDINKNNQGVRISNIPDGTTEKEFKEWLGGFNLPMISRVNMIKDKRTGECKPFAFITFRNKENACKAIEMLNGSKMDYSIINVELSKY